MGRRTAPGRLGRPVRYPGASGVTGRAPGRAISAWQRPPPDGRAAGRRSQPRGGAMNLTVVLADDHAIVRQGLWAVLETVPGLHLVGEAADGLEAVRLVERLRPDVLVLDLVLPG